MESLSQQKPYVPEPSTGDTPRRNRTARYVLLGFLAFFVLAVVVSGVFVFNLANSFDTKAQKIDQAFPAESLRPTKPTTGAGANTTNILVLGSDSRGATLNTAEQGVASDQRSDTMMLVHIPADHKNVYAMSIMRDTWVTIPGHGDAKINAAMAFGGVPLVVQTLEGMFDTRIDHVMIVDFEGFKSITDAVGGVQVNNPATFQSSFLKGHTFERGVHSLTGEEALAFVRERYAFSDGDYQRVKNQQLFLKAVLAKVLTPSTLANPVTVSNLVGKFSPFVSVDKSLNAGAIAGLALELKDIRSSNIKTFTLPNLGTGTSADGQSIVINDAKTVKEIAEAMKDDQLASYLDVHGLVH
ncbi:LCP family protein [Arthrobacter sp. A2-55]|uniref:LCP family protein n=1 Tax=Arthrobacter sp. A2-55 TaxID=2897337 RepID=UPI0021CD44E2|nr:LCP family protein [Arthrobacter sp. A2-55]MCU6479918.1 LCP family protein [Arthrobacter sp. A2-55]